MTLEELQQDKELFEVCMKEVEEKVSGGQDPEQAKLEVFRAHGVQFDEDAVKAKLVAKMELSAEELANVTGGEITNWCSKDYSCFIVYRKDRGNQNDACAWNFLCYMVQYCDGGYTVY